MECFAVTAATGALGPLLEKLTAMLGDEYKLQEGTRRDIVSIKSCLEPVHDLLGKLWWREDLDAACKDWMAVARELSYDMEDRINCFNLRLEHGDSGFIQQETMDNPCKGFMETVKGVSKRSHEMQTTSEAICNRSKLTTDPRARFLHEDASELVGMEEKRQDLIKLLQEHEMVCIVGFAGMGKTTLADLVYQTIGGQFQCRAFVSVHLSANMMEILGTIFYQIITSASSGGSQQNIIDDISNSLSDKRYLVVIDDIWHWEEWEVILKALPKNNLGSQIIMTTRINNIAEKCPEQGAHVYSMDFPFEDTIRLSEMRLTKSVGRDIFDDCAKGLPRKIADMSHGMPLAVICFSTAWAENPVQGDSWVSHVMDGFLSIPSLKPLVQSVCHGFDDLPVDLRTCLLYCSMFPRDYLIEKDCLVRKWIAEGFVSQEDVAEAYLDKLVSRNLLQPKPFLENNYTVHPIMLAFLVCKANQDNFVACRHYSRPGSSLHVKQIRRLSLDMNVNYNGALVLIMKSDKDLSHIRSIVIFSSPLGCLRFEKIKYLRVLEIIDSEGIQYQLVAIFKLIFLRYLGLKGKWIRDLPQNIWGLQNLETLDVRSTYIKKFPMEIGEVKHLETLDASNTLLTELPKEIEKLQYLKTLNVSCTQVSELPREIGNLQHLKTLNVRQTQVSELPREIGNLQHLETLNISGTVISKLPTEIEKLQYLKTLNVSETKITELPREIGNLQHLETLNISGTVISKLPTEIQKLQYLKTLNVSETKITELPREITKLQRLENLDVSNTKLRKLPTEMGKLQHLRTLDITLTMLRELYWEVPNSLTVIFGSMNNTAQEQKVTLDVGPSWNNSISSSSGAKCREDISIVVLINRFDVFPVPIFRVAGRHINIPQWVKEELSNVSSLDIRLCKLGEGDLEFLKQMANLQALLLRFEVLPREPIAVTGGGFSKLETFYVDCRLPRVITFEEGAMPKLKHLEFKFYSGQASQDYRMGIKNLPRLEKVVFRSSEYYTSDSPVIRATIEVVRKEAAERRDMIELYVDNHLELLGEGRIRLADKAISDKRDKQLHAATTRERKARQQRFIARQCN